MGIGVDEVVVLTPGWYKVVDWILALPLLSIKVGQKWLALGLLIELNERWKGPGAMFALLIVQVVE